MDILWIQDGYVIDLQVLASPNSSKLRGKWLTKSLTILLISVLLIFSLNVTPAIAQSFFEKKCPTCGGTGKITTIQMCQDCNGTGTVKPTITLKSREGWGSLSGIDWAAFVKGVFENEEDIGVYGRATAEVETLTTTYMETSERTYFPSHEEVPIILVIEEIVFGEDWVYTIYVSQADNINCPSCGGTGAVSVISDCPECGGSGYVINPMTVGGVIIGVATMLAIAFVLAKRGKSEAKIIE